LGAKVVAWAAGRDGNEDVPPEKFPHQGRHNIDMNWDGNNLGGMGILWEDTLNGGGR